jgi:hypothetical protein
VLRDDEDPRLWEARPARFHQLERIAAAQAQIEQQEVGFVLLDGGASGRDAISFRTNNEVFFPANQLNQALTDQRMIVDDDYLGR